VFDDFDHRIVNITDHRPWPLPRRPWVMMQTWNELLFAHWAVAPPVLAPVVPSVLTLDTYDGRAWIGVVPFLMTNVGVRGAGPVPGVSSFPELNVRTYVRVGHKPGVYFFSLDATNPVAVGAARLLRLPYFVASMDVDVEHEAVTYRSRRFGGHAEFDATYQPTGEPFHAEPGSLDAFLTERYCLYTTTRRGGIRRLDIHHPRWALRRAEADISRNTMTRPLGIEIAATPDLLHFSKRQDTVAWPPCRVRTP
jgi:hypothetical protein